MALSIFQEFQAEMNKIVIALQYARNTTVDPNQVALFNQVLSRVGTANTALTDAYQWSVDHGTGSSLSAQNPALADHLKNSLIALGSELAGLGATALVAGAGFASLPAVAAGVVAGSAAAAFFEWIAQEINVITPQINGTNGNEIIIGGNTSTTVNLLNGNDTFISGDVGTTFTVNGGAGSDSIYLKSAQDKAYGGTGNDFIYTGVGGGTAFGDAGDDRLTGNANKDTLTGGDGADLILGRGGNDLIGLGTANQQISGTGNGDRAVGGDGADNIFGTNGNDIILGDDFGQQEFNIAISSELLALKGNLDLTSYVAGTVGGADVIYAGGGDDIVSGGKLNDVIDGGAGIDYLFGDSGNDGLTGGAGDDVLFGGSGADSLVGGADYDTAAYWTSAVGIQINLSTPASGTGDAKGDTFSSIEHIRATYYNDIIDGGTYSTLQGISADSGNDTIIGGKSATDIYGDAGSDTIFGGYRRVQASGNVETTDNVRDYLMGGANADTYHVSAITDSVIVGRFDYEVDTAWWNNADVITDTWSDSTIKVTDNTVINSAGDLDWDNLFLDFKKIDNGPTIDVEGNLLINTAEGESTYSAEMYIKMIDGDGYLYSFTPASTPGDIKISAIAILENFNINTFQDYVV